MIKNSVIYGDPTNIAMFDESNDTNRIMENGKLLPESGYDEELLKLYEESLNSIPTSLECNVGDSIRGKIASITQTEILLDTGGKEYAYISITKDKLNPESYKIGEELDVLVVENNGYIKASPVEYVKNCLYNEMKGIGNQSVYEATVLELTDNGYILDIDGVKVFMPGSLGGINMLLDFKELLGKTIKVLPIKNENKYSKFKNQLIVSHRAYLETFIPGELEKLEIGNVYSGKVTGTQHFGVFVEFNNVLTGMIHKDDFDEGLTELFDKGEVVPGREIDFYLKEIVSSSKLVLSRFPIDLEKINEPKFSKGDVIDGKVVKTVKYGCFVALGKNTTSLLHISKYKEGEEYKKGDKVKVKVTDNKDNKYTLDLA